MKTIKQLLRPQGAYCSKLLILCLFIIAGLSDLSAAAGVNTDPEDDLDDGCGGSGTGNNSVSFNFDFPILPLERGLGSQRLSVKREEPTPSLFTPISLNYSSKITTFVSSITAEGQLPTGISHEFELRDENNNAVKYQVPSGSSVARPVGDFTGSDDRVLLLAADYEQIDEMESPVYYRLIKGDGSEIDYALEIGEFALRVKTPAGRVIEAGDQFDIVLQDGAYRQIRSAAGLVDLVVIDDFSYKLSFYTDANAGTPGAGGLYVPEAGPEGEPEAEAEAYRTILIRNPTGDPDRFDRIQIVETQGTYERISEWEYITAAQDWRFMKGLESMTDTQGMLTEQIIVREDEATGDVIETRELRDESAELVSSNFERLHTFPWGDDLAIESVKDATQFALTTTYSYYENSGENGYGRRKQTVNPDGSWTSYVYDSEDRMIQQAKPWMDSPVGSSVADTRATIYSYDPVDSRDVAAEFDSRTRTTITQVRGTETGRTYNAYFLDPIINEEGDTIYEYTEIEERTTTLEEDGEGPDYGDPSNLRTTRVYYADNADAASAGRLKRVTTPDGVVMAYSYAQATAQDAFVKTVDRLGSSGFVPFKSTRQVTTKDTRGNVVQEASYVRVGTDWQLLSTTTQEFSDEISTKGFQLTKRFKDGRLTLQQGWFGPLVGDRTTETGEYYLYDYDLLNRLAFEMKAGVNGTENITTNYTRDLGAIGCGCDGQAIVERTSGGLTLNSFQKTDSAGRRSETSGVNGYTTTYGYLDDRRVTTMESPDGSTRITENYLDGRMKSVTGTGVIPEYYTYTENADGSITTRVDVASTVSSRYRETTVDVAGRLVRDENPATDGGTIVRAMAYNALGLLSKQTETGRAATRYEYDALANLVRSGLDVDGSDSLTIDSSDRITDSNRFMEQDGAGDWFAISTTTVYPETGATSANAVEVSRSAQRLSNFPLATAYGDLASESTSADVNGNLTKRQIYIDGPNKTVTQMLDTPTSANDVFDEPEFFADVSTITVNGLLVSQNSPTVAAPTIYGYDALERRVSIKDPRHAQASSIDYYTGTRQVFTRTDAAGNTTAFAYYDNDTTGAGQVKSVTDALGQKSYQAYDLLGRQILTWGETDYPQAYSYNSYGELETLTTWRDSAGMIDFSTATWPSPTGGDVTTWTYQASTGLLARKQYADTNGTDYTYDSANRLAVRTWARDGGLDTTYSYDANTGELLNVNYQAVDTADITYTYDRLGRQATVTDATGTRSFDYDTSSLQLDFETLDATFYQGQQLTRNYDNLGRASGYLLEDSASSAISAGNYTYDLSGRLQTVTDGTDTFTYGYTTDSNLLASLTAPQHTVAYTYESNRNVMTAIENHTGGTTLLSSYTYESNRNVMTTIENHTGGTTLLSSYTYTYDALGRRADRQQACTAFTTSTDAFSYNSRSEVTASSNDVEIVAQWNPTYSFDQIGNRKSSTGFQPVASYTSNSVNQYTSLDAVIPTYDLDGNLLSNSTWTYTWNNENRLSSATDGTTTIDFVYDYQGRLVKKDDGTNVEVYVYDGWNRIATFDSQASSLSLQFSYLWGLDLSGSMQGAGGVGGLLKEGDYYPTYDANGNVMQKLDGNGAVAMSVYYDPFGNIVAGTLVGEYAFSTKPMVDGLDWYYYGFRYYDPATGRWPSRDPIGEYGGLNLYAFIFNYTIGYVDYLGLYETEQAAAEAALQAALNLFNSDPNNANKGTEYCGYILKKCTDGKIEYSFNGPFVGSEPGYCRPEEDFSDPWRLSGSRYHTHPSSNAGFSDTDKEGLTPGSSNWLGDPDGGLHQWQQPPLPPSCINQCGDIDVRDDDAASDFNDYYNSDPSGRETDHGNQFG